MAEVAGLEDLLGVDDDVAVNEEGVELLNEGTDVLPSELEDED